MMIIMLTPHNKQLFPNNKRHNFSCLLKKLWPNPFPSLSQWPKSEKTIFNLALIKKDRRGQSRHVSVVVRSGTKTEHYHHHHHHHHKQLRQTTRVFDQVSRETQNKRSDSNWLQTTTTFYFFFSSSLASFPSFPLFSLNFVASTLNR